ncbi:MAG: alpha-galactosidase [Candidatus Omnitrophica bacterium]|nr:alpha-galactosidase [Candidatus Omnitrophota bacterium]
MKKLSLLLFCCSLLALKVEGQSTSAVLDIPAGAANDEIMASPEQVQEMQDWAGATFAGGNFTKEDKAFLLGQRREAPFSFVYGGAASADLLNHWPQTVETKDQADFVERQVSWRDPQTALVVTAVVKAYKHYPAVDWVLYFENKGSLDTPILEKIQAVDVQLVTGPDKRPAILHELRGDSCSDQSFTPFTATLPVKQNIRLAPSGGRPSAISAFPFFNFQYADQGFIAAIGWSGQWAAAFDRAEQGPTRFQAGMELTHLLLHPGEKIRTPRILLMSWHGDLRAAQNRFRRLMLFHYVPKVDNKPAPLPVVLQCFDRYSWSRADWATEAGQIAAAKSAHEMGMNTLWLDAAWFPGGFPNGVGNWSAKPKEFPNGLKPVSDECHRLGMKFVLWFEPERVAAGTEIAREHPEFVFGGEKGGLFKLNDPVACRFLTDLLSRRISEYGIDIYRNDFNIDPLGFWRGNDTPDRQGITEIRYVEGHYAMWDELLKKHPGLMIDNCASGGRRIDLETCMRSVPLWRSDTSCSPGHPDWNQVQSMGLSQYIPFHTACVWAPDAYDVRSAATAGLICQLDYMNPSFPMDLAKASIAEVKADQKYWYGDFYPLSNASIDPDQFIAYQLHRPDLNSGIVLAFRHPGCNFLGVIVGLHGLDPGLSYTVEFINDQRQKTTEVLSGQDLMNGVELRLGKPGTSLLVRYQPVSQ